MLKQVQHDIDKLIYYNQIMAEFISTFITGFQDVVKADLEKRFAGIKILNLYDGLVHYKFDGDSHQLEKINYFNNTFFVLKTMKGKGLSFPSLVGAVCSSKSYFLVNKGSFRVRFQQENQFAKVDKNLTRRVEEFVLRNSKLKLDRLSPTNEIWFCIRREGFAFCGELISKREFTEKNLNQGELRPEIAYLICAYAELPLNAVVADPFCGYGSIPIQLGKRFKCGKIFASDIDKTKIELLGKKFNVVPEPVEGPPVDPALRQAQGPHDGAQGQQIDLRQADAFELDHIQDSSIDKIITDPPWGLWESIPDIEAFYNKMFVSFLRVLKPEGSMTILSARTKELEDAATAQGLTIKKSLHTLVNGKKASVYYLYKYAG